MQAAAWLPWLALLAYRAVRTGSTRWAAATAIALALQVLAGHSQVVYITCCLLGLVWMAGIASSVSDTGPDSLALRLVTIARRALLGGLTGVIALGLAAVQLLPTLELTREGIRSEGLSLRDATAFSLPPWEALVALLPTLDGPQVSSEWVGWVTVSGLTLAGFAILRSRRSALLPLLVAAAALVMAFGQFTPTYRVLFELVPGLDLYRVPARWLLLYSAAMATLVALGIDSMARNLPGRANQVRPPGLLVALGILSTAVVLGAVGLLTERVLGLVGVDVPVPGPLSITLWAVAFTATIGILLLSSRVTDGDRPIVWRSRSSYSRFALVGLIAAEVVFASNRLDVARGNVTEAIAASTPSVEYLSKHIDGHRVLPFSDNSFEIGIIDALRDRYAGALTPDEIRELAIAMKYRETLTPNLPMSLRIQSLGRVRRWTPAPQELRRAEVPLSARRERRLRRTSQVAPFPSARCSLAGLARRAARPDGQAEGCVG